MFLNINLVFKLLILCYLFIFFLLVIPYGIFITILQLITLEDSNIFMYLKINKLKLLIENYFHVDSFTIANNINLIKSSVIYNKACRILTGFFILKGANAIFYIKLILCTLNDKEYSYIIKNLGVFGEIFFSFSILLFLNALISTIQILNNSNISAEKKNSYTFFISFSKKVRL